MRALMWFRSDLRVADNPALHQACRQATDGVIGVFAVCERQWAEHDWGAAKVDFVLRNVRALSQALAAFNIPLKIIYPPRFSEVPEALLAVAEGCRCEALYFNREYEVNEARRDRQVELLFRSRSRSVHAFHDQTAVDITRLRSSQGGWYRVFGPFRRAWLHSVKQEGTAPLPGGVRRQPDMEIRPDPVPEARGPLCGADRALWPEGERAATRRLARFIEQRIGRYGHARNYPGLDGTSMLSAYLAAGVLSARQCLHAAREANDGRVDSGRSGVVAWINELCWRDFYRHVVVGFPRVCMGRAFRAAAEALPWRRDEADFTAWCEGRTGFPIVDAAMRQLHRTGWMHNRLRMISAMFLAKHLFIDWRWGERYFMQRLVDGDLASNNGGWQWSASTGTDAAPYFRIFNPSAQSRRFDPQGEFIRRFVPELGDVPARLLHDPAALAESAGRRLDYPPPICDHRAARRRALEHFQQAFQHGRAGADL